MSNNGKGSTRRGNSREELKRYEENYLKIFNNGKRKKKNSKNQ